LAISGRSSGSWIEEFTYWSTRVLTPARSGELRLMIADLDQVDDVNDLGALLRV
jgi:hypothetical protein